MRLFYVAKIVRCEGVNSVTTQAKRNRFSDKKDPLLPRASRTPGQLPVIFPKNDLTRAGTPSTSAIVRCQRKSDRSRHRARGALRATTAPGLPARCSRNRRTEAARLFSSCRAPYPRERCPRVGQCLLVGAWIGIEREREHRRDFAKVDPPSFKRQAVEVNFAEFDLFVGQLPRSCLRP